MRADPPGLLFINQQPKIVMGLRGLAVVRTVERAEREKTVGARGARDE